MKNGDPAAIIASKTKSDSRPSGPMMGKNVKEMAFGGSIVFIGKLVSTGVKYFTQLVMVWMLGADLFGLYSIGMAFCQLLEMVSGAGLQMGAVKYVVSYRIAKDKERLKGVLLNTIRYPFFFGAIIGGFLFWRADYLSILLFKKDELPIVLKAFAVALPFGAVMTASVFASTGFNTTKYLVYVVHFLQPLINLIAVVLLCDVGFGLLGASASWCIAAVLGCCCSVFFVHKLFPDLFSSDIKPTFEGGKLLRFSFPLLSGSFLWVAILWTDILMIGIFQNARDVGIYRAASQTALLSTFIAASLDAIFTSKVAHAYENRDTKDTRELYEIATRWNWTLTLPIFLTISIASKDLMSFFGHEFRLGWIIVTMLCCGHLIRSVASCSASILIMTGNQIAKMVGDIISLILNVFLNLFWIPKYGIIGAAMATGISMAAIGILRLLQVYFLIGIQPFSLKFIKAFVAGAISGGAGILIQFGIKHTHYMFSFVLTAIVVFVTFILVIAMLRIEEPDKIILRGILTKFRPR